MQSIIWNSYRYQYIIILCIVRKIHVYVLEYREIPLIVIPRRIAKERKEPRESRSSGKSAANYRLCIFHPKMRGRNVYSRGICICPRIDRLPSSISIYSFAYQSLGLSVGAYLKKTDCKVKRKKAEGMPVARVKERERKKKGEKRDRG